MSRNSYPRVLSRRKFIGSAGALAIASSLPLAHSVAAQEASPAVSSQSSPVASPVAVGFTESDWGTFGYDYGQTRHVPFTDITKDNVGDLGIVWSFDFLEDDDSIPPANQCYPIVVNETIYVTTTYNNIYALDARTGEKKWKWAPDNIGFFKNFGVSANRGVAYGNGSVFMMSLDMHIYKVNAETGELEQDLQIWDVVPDAKPEYGYYESTAPIFYDNKLFF